MEAKIKSSIAEALASPVTNSLSQNVTNFLSNLSRINYLSDISVNNPFSNVLVNNFSSNNLINNFSSNNLINNFFSKLSFNFSLIFFRGAVAHPRLVSTHTLGNFRRNSPSFFLISCFLGGLPHTLGLLPHTPKEQSTQATLSFFHFFTRIAQDVN